MPDDVSAGGREVDRGYECCCDGEICGEDPRSGAPGASFRCAGCGTRVPECWGSSDDLSAYCDYCATRMMFQRLIAAVESPRD